MSEFQFDTSGVVRSSDQLGDYIAWPHLSPFAQGYVRRALEDLDKARLAEYRATAGRSVPVRLGYSYLAPATLAAMLKDCEARETQLYAIGIRRHDQRLGAIFWLTRQRGDLSDFQPVVLSLAEDGLIYQQKAQPDVD